jgi:DNA-directed RNA polymerase subunit RPC12/RpoP
MPFVDFLCKDCGHAFCRLAYKGDETSGTVCPCCGSGRIKTQPKSESLFDGTISTSSLLKDVN